MALGSARKQRIDDLAQRAAAEPDVGVSLAASAWRRLRRNPVFLLGAAIVVVFVVVDRKSVV
jgi:peptide/nickel transport system permease protein